jgi:aldose 1-epimerase
MNCTISPFGKIDNDKVFLYTFITENGLEVSITNYGATITAINLLQDEDSIKLTYGFDNLDPYLKSEILPAP